MVGFDILTWPDYCASEVDAAHLAYATRLYDQRVASIVTARSAVLEYSRAMSRKPPKRLGEVVREMLGPRPGSKQAATRRKTQEQIRTTCLAWATALGAGPAPSEVLNRG